MPLDKGRGPKRVAVIGAGISGMAAAHMLADDHAVTLYEAEGRLGGHARTRMAGSDKDVAVDTGFIVFNYANYPHLTALFAELDVPVAPSNMSFGASINGGALEYGLVSLDALFAQRRNLLKPKYWRMLRDIFHFNANGLKLAKDGMSTGDLLETLGTGEWFRDRYLLPFSGAIWSTPKAKIMDFPAKAMMTFFENHALLSATGQHQWYTVHGGSIEYVKRLEASMVTKGVDIRLGAPIDCVNRTDLGVHVTPLGADAEIFDEVVFATHSDDALRLLADANAAETSALGSVGYQPNHVVLHSDASVMPRKKQVWSSWNYTEAAGKQDDQIDLTYWMNKLQPLETEHDFFVTLNSTREIDPSLIWDEVVLRHPVYDAAALAAQDIVKTMNGANNTWFCGAWLANGFHEDGIKSAVEVVEAMRATSALAAAE